MLSDIIFRTFLKTLKPPVYKGVKKGSTECIIEEDEECMQVYSSSFELEEVIIDSVRIADKMVSSYKRNPIWN